MPIEQHLLIFIFTTIGASYGIAFGGGSFMVLPVLFLLGVDPKIAIATNITAAIAQLVTGAFIFGRHKKVHYEVAPSIALFFLIGGIMGAFLLIEIDPNIIKSIVSIAIIFFAAFALFRRKSLLEGACKTATRKSLLAYPLIIIVGAYQIMITAGAGTLLTFILIYLFGLNLKCSIYTRQIISLPTLLVAAGIFIYSGLVDWTLFIPLVLGRVAGAFIGSEMVMHTESKKLSIVFSIIVILIAIKTLLG